MVKRKISGFEMYLEEFKAKEHRKRGHHTMPEWVEIVKPFYEKLTAEEKEVYKQKAKAQPPKVVPAKSKSKKAKPKYTSHGVPLEQIEREELELVEKRKYMEKTVKTIVENAFLNNNIKTRPFIFVMANFFYKTSDGQYSPAEIAVMKFNFENAIYRLPYHAFVDPGVMTLGYAFEAKEHSEETHRLPPPPDAIGEKNYDRVYGEILKLIDVNNSNQDNPKRPFVFVREQDVEMIESVLDQLSDGQWRQTFDIFHLELLFNKLKNKVDTVPGSNPLPLAATNQFIEQDRYDATPNIACDFHEKEDAAKHCALSYVKRWFYLFADNICPKIDVELEPGKHLPANAAIGPQKPQLPSRHDDDDDDWDDDAAASSSSEQKRMKIDRVVDDDDRDHPMVSSIIDEHDSDSSEEKDY